MSRELDISAIPLCLRQLPQWVCWKREQRKGKWTKVPYDPKTGRKASSTDPATWTTFEEAPAAWRRNEAYDGIGYVFTGDDPYCGIDLDNCIDTGTGKIKPWGQRILLTLDSYSEISPSGAGVKVIVQATKPGDKCKKPYEDGVVEIYDQGRFFTITGRRLAQTSVEVENRQHEANEIYAEVFSPASPSAPTAQSAGNPRTPAAGVGLTDEQILEKASRSRKSGAKFSALWAGKWDGHFKSASEADSSVVFTVAFYTKDAAQIDRMFRTSGLMRPKWDERHGADTYGQITIKNALQMVTKQYQPKKNRLQPPAAPGLPGSPATAPDEPMVALGTRDPASGKLVLSTSRTLPTAEAFIREHQTHPDGRTMHNYAGMLMGWRGNRYAEVEDEAVRNKLQPWLHVATHYSYNREAREMELTPFPANPSSINVALDSIRTLTHLPASMAVPSWLGDGSGKPDPREVLSCRSLNLHIPTATTFPATPTLFNINSLEFDYDPAAAAPEKWLAFLHQLWPDDEQSIELLQEWCGYSITADTSQQKMLLLLGPKRCGKGTIGRVFTGLVGAGNVAGPTTSSLAGPFGLQPLIDKSLAIVSDARFKGDDIAIVVERLLCISGEDRLTIDRKHIGSVTMKLPTRFMFLTNELPGASDASGALAGRFLVLRFTKSFFGCEDTELTNKLLAELPGILLWALQGWQRLHKRGRFVQPASVEDAIGDLEDLFSPVGAFVRERCLVGNGHSVEMSELFAAWRDYCQTIGRNHAGTIQTFGRDLRAVMPALRVSRPRVAGDRSRSYEGLSLTHGNTQMDAQGGAKW